MSQIYWKDILKYDGKLPEPPYESYQNILGERLRKQILYSIALQRAIEYHCKNLEIPEEITIKCPHHAKMLNLQLAKTS